MSKFVVNTGDPAIGDPPKFGGYAKPKRGGRVKKIFAIIGISLALFAGIGAIGGYFYWRSLQDTPQYSLALIIDAARRDDQTTIDQLVDSDAVAPICGASFSLY